MNVAQQRRAMLAGIAFVVLLVASVLLNFGDTPEVKSSDTAETAAAKWVHELSSSGHRVGLIVSGYLLVLAGIGFVWFCTGLRDWLVPSAGAGRAITALSALAAGALAVAAMAAAVVPGGVEFGENPLPQSGEVIRVTGELFYPLMFVVFGLTSAAIIAAVTATATGAKTLPRWLAYAGWLAVLGSIAGVAFFPLVLPLLWYLAVAIVGFTRAGRAGATAAPIPGPAAAGT